MKIEIGQIAPEFVLQDAQEKLHRLSDYLNQWVVLYFYPKDNTSVCTIEACKFRDDFGVFGNMNTVILGISLDSSNSHQHFSTKLALPFELLADVTGQTCRAYGTLIKLGPIRYCKRQSFIIDPQGEIAKIYRSVSAAKHSSQVQDDLRKLQATVD